MIAHRRSDVDELNGRARALMHAAGALGTAELRLADRGFATGDVVVLRRNDRDLGVANGDRGTITAVDPATRTLELDLPGRRVRLDARYLDSPARHGPALQHAYAITGHVAKGLTFRQTFVLATDQTTREWGYSALSRGREANRLYAFDTERDERDEYAPADHPSLTVGERLAGGLGRSEAQRFATDNDREQQLIDELRCTLAEREPAARAHRDALQTRRELERTPPAPLRFRARQHHRDTLAQARGAETLASRRVDALREREGNVRDQLEQERKTRATDQPLSPAEGLERTLRETRA